MTFDRETSPELIADAPAVVQSNITEATPAFASLGLHEALVRAVHDSGYECATEVQGQAIPPALSGEDLMVSSRTGSGKTASFILPALQMVIAARGELQEAAKRKGAPRGRAPAGPTVLVLAPTRELAQQVAKAAQTYGRHIQGLRVATVLGGMPYAQQIRMLSGPLDILIATPGRLMDLIDSGRCSLEQVRMFVLDEADRMLDMGFIEDIEYVASKLPEQRQTLMYSATFAGNAGRLASQLMREPRRIEVSGHTESHANIEQRLHWADNSQHKRKLLEHILAERDLDQAVVFTSTQQDAEWLAEQLAEIGHRVASLHGGMPQGKRNRTLMALRRRDLRVLVATDVAARGIDVPTISHVINYGLPMKAEDYVHRIGRTGRAGRSGVAVTLAERQDLMMIKRIQQFTTQPIPVARIEGLEPRMEEPRIFMNSRPVRDGRGAPAGRGGHGGRGGPRGGDGFGPRGGNFRERGNERVFDNNRYEGPAGEPRFDAPARGHARPDARPNDRAGAGRFEGRPEGRFEPRGEGRFERGPRQSFGGDRRGPGTGQGFESRGPARPDAALGQGPRAAFQRDRDAAPRWEGARQDGPGARPARKPAGAGKPFGKGPRKSF
ncbi:DEAD/DEAH box helicase [Roseateles sp. BYS180W]|uniref:DEAD/DEAH box helicase n=1 Tax=Roseateles rivi TaxID=3299028 RepID=A0ABW7FXW3_9BURK